MNHPLSAHMLGRGLLAFVLMATLGLAAAASARATTHGWSGRAEAPHYKEEIFPPWQHGANDPAVQRGFTFTVPEVDDLADFHGNPENARLVIYVGGNYYFAMAPLVRAFEAMHPRLRGRIYYETLPPGILIRQMMHHDTITVGNMTWRAVPDVYAAGKLKVLALVRKHLLVPPVVPYVTNDLAIMIPKGNPGHVRGLRSLGRPRLRLSMPNPAWEGVARQIKISLIKAGGRRLEREVYGTKVRDGETILTHIHHRQTPLYLMQGLADAGVTWKSEAIFQEEIGHPISYVRIPARENTVAIYAAAEVRDAPHPRAARAWLKFLRTRRALRIFEHYGFKPYRAR
jgi:ABC-type molybdate transport system substrate-binding protein